MRLHAADLGLLRYVQGHAVADERGRVLAAARGAPEPFDGVAELYWSSEIEFERCLATPEARRAGRILLEDERRFIDLACSPIFFSREHQLVP